MRVALALVFVLSAGVAFAGGERKYRIEGGQVVVEGPIEFETGTGKLEASSEGALSAVAEYLKDKPYVSLLRVEAHVAAQGSSAANLKLTEERALSVARWLVAHGVDCKRLIATGFGDTKPVAGNDTAEGRSKNTRIAFVNAELKGKAIGGMPVDGGGKVAGDVCR